MVYYGGKSTQFFTFYVLPGFFFYQTRIFVIDDFFSSYLKFKDIASTDCYTFCNTFLVARVALRLHGSFPQPEFTFLLCTMIQSLSLCLCICLLLFYSLSLSPTFTHSSHQLSQCATIFIGCNTLLHFLACFPSVKFSVDVSLLSMFLFCQYIGYIDTYIKLKLIPR